MMIYESEQTFIALRVSLSRINHCKWLDFGSNHPYSAQNTMLMLPGFAPFSMVFRKEKENEKVLRFRTYGVYFHVVDHPRPISFPFLLYFLLSCSDVQIEFRLHYYFDVTNHTNVKLVGL